MAQNFEKYTLVWEGNVYYNMKYLEVPSPPPPMVLIIGVMLP